MEHHLINIDPTGEDTAASRPMGIEEQCRVNINFLSSLSQTYGNIKAATFDILPS